ncbi:MAG: exodeoxyribonuclease III [Candidatus Magasanikbacteria bacterium]
MRLSILSWNVNGIRAVGKKGFADFLIDKKPDILGIQEVKIADTMREKTQFDFGGYTEYWNSAKRPGYAGTMTLLKEKSVLAKRFIGHTTDTNHMEFNGEGRIQTLEFDAFYLVNVYFPNTRHDLSRLPFKEEFNGHFLKYIQKLDKKKPVIAIGDYNVAHEEIDIARPKDNEQNAGFTPQERKWMTKFLRAGFVDTYRELNPKKIQYTWWSFRFNVRKRNIGWRIDYVLASKRLLPKVKTAFIWDQQNGSDHCPIGIEIDI